MPQFEFIKIVDVKRDLIFQISTDYENFTKILPDYFKELKIIKKTESVAIIQEKLQFLGRTVDVLTEHRIENQRGTLLECLMVKLKDQYLMKDMRCLVNIPKSQ